MYLRRIASSLKHQDWVTVIIELTLVMFGVLIALQMNNWNEARINKDGAGNTLIRLRGEVALNITTLDRGIALLEESNDSRRAGIMALQTCDTSTDATETLSDAIGNLTRDIVPSFVDNTLQELSRRDRYLDFLSNDFRTAINLYSSSLTDERDQSRINFGLMWDEHVIKHPMIGIDFKGAELPVPFFTFNEPMKTLCNDTGFRRQFIMTDVWHQSALLRMQRFKTSNEKFLAEIDAELEAFR